MRKANAEVYSRHFHQDITGYPHLTYSLSWQRGYMLSTVNMSKLSTCSWPSPKISSFLPFGLCIWRLEECSGALH